MSCPSPPPPMPSPVLVPTPLPSPPPLSKNLQRGKTPSHDTLFYASASHHSGASRTLKRTLSQIPARCRSPPPSPAIRSPPPPVPPIPPFVLTTRRSFIRPSIADRAPPLDPRRDRPREDRSHATDVCCEAGALGCMQFFAMRNSTRPCRA